ncbi:hypothetical protein JCM3770_001017 [Rhodotorula araucariae]
MSPQIDRPAHIATLISSVDRYNPGNCHLLEDYLQQQLASGSYDLLANLALLKLYQFNPAILSPSASLSILFLAIAHAPFAPDFALAFSLLSDSFAVGGALPAPPADSDDDDASPATAAREPAGERATAERLQALSALLHARKFRAFWTLVRDGGSAGEGDDDELLVRKAVEGMAAAAPGWEDALRGGIAAEVERCFRSIKRDTLASFLGTSDIAATAEKRGWTVDGDDVKIPQNESNTPKAQVTHERIEIEQLGRLLGRSQA